jgi:spore germination protein GerM
MPGLSWILFQNIIIIVFLVQYLVHSGHLTNIELNKLHKTNKAKREKKNNAHLAGHQWFMPIILATW